MPPPCYTARQEQRIAGRLGDLLDGFTRDMVARGYSSAPVSWGRLGAIHLGAWCQRRRVAPAALDDDVLRRFVRHLPRCSCPVRRRAKQHQQESDAVAAKQMLGYLRSLQIAAPSVPVTLPPLAKGFVSALRSRGLSEATIDTYLPKVLLLLKAIGAAPSRYRARELRRFIARASRPDLSRATVKGLITATRAFLEYLTVQGRCAPALVDALPKVAHWRLATVPRYVSSADIERAVAVPSHETAIGMRNRAILLLLARLGLRAGEVARLQLTDIDRARRRVRIVSSKTGPVVWLPTPPDVDRALGVYLSKGRPATTDGHVFVRTRAPFVGSPHGAIVTHAATRALLAAKVDAPAFGAYLFRHSLATGLLRDGWTLDAIGALFRHRRHSTTAIYAKVDLETLRLVVQPWPVRDKTR